MHYAVIGVALLVAAIIAYFSARTWHWGHVLVVFGLFVLTGTFFFLSAEVLRINRVYREAITRKTTELEQITAANNALEKGTSDPGIIARLQSEQEPAVNIPENAESIPSLDELDHKILLASRLRGPVWRNVSPAGIDASGVKVNIPSPLPAKFQDRVVYLFEEGPAQLPTPDGKPQGRQYLGEFRVTQASGQQATLVPVQPLDAFEQQRLAASRAPWVIYETMPVDRHEIFAGMTDEQLKQRLPAQSVQEYLRHGKEATADDDEARVVGYDAEGKRLAPEELATAAKRVYQRRLRDYAGEFDELARRRVAMEIAIAEVRKDIERLTVALATAKELQAYREKEISRLKTDLAGIQKERAAIEQHLAQLKQQLARANELLSNLLKQNSELARRLAGEPSAAAPAITPLALDAK